MNYLVQYTDPDELLDVVAAALREESTSDFPNPVIVWPQTKPNYRANQFFRRLVSNRRIQLVASLVLIALLGGFVSIPWGSTAARAFAQVQSAVKNAKSAVFRHQTFFGEKIESTYTFTVNDAGFLRADGANEVHIVNTSEAKTMDIWHGKREVKIRPIIDPLEMRQMLMGPYVQLFELHASTPTEMTEKSRDGRKVREFRITLYGNKALAIVDAETQLPIRVEVDRGKNSNGELMRDVMSEFAFNQPADIAMFAIKPPEGYAVDNIEPQPPGAGTESYVISPEKGLGPVRFGMTTQEITAILGQPDKKETRDAMVTIVDGKFPILSGKDKNTRFVPAEPRFTIDELIYDSRGFRLSVSSKEGMSGIHCFDRYTMGPSSRKFLGKTTEGVAIGSDWNKVMQTYGEPRMKKEKVFAYFTMPSMQLEFRDEKLRSIRISVPRKDPTK